MKEVALSPWRAIRAKPRWRGTQVVSSEVSRAERMSASKVRGQRRPPWGVGSRGQDLGSGRGLWAGRRGSEPQGQSDRW